MSKQAISTIKIVHWDEKPFHEETGSGKLTRVSVRKSYTGEFEGEGTLEYLMSYGLNNFVTFVGMERLVGRLAGKSGSFAIQINGVFSDGIPNESFVILPDSPVHELAGLRGQGGFSADGTAGYRLHLDYDLGENTAG